MEKQKTRAVILAAGKGTRMNSAKSKVLHTVLGKTIIEYVVDALESAAVEKIAVVVGPHNLDEVRAQLGSRVDYLLQKEQLGTGHALMSASGWLTGFEGSLLVMVGDAPFIKKEIIQNLVKKQQRDKKAVSFLTTIFENPPPWGRVIRDSQNRVVRIVEEKDATAEEKQVKEVSSSHYCFNWQKLEEVLGQLKNNNAQGEYYLPDVIELMIKRGWQTDTELTHDFLPTFGINTPADLQFAEKEMARIKREN